jgi:hypothetical protein
MYPKQGPTLNVQRTCANPNIRAQEVNALAGTASEGTVRGYLQTRCYSDCMDTIPEHFGKGGRIEETLLTQC